MGGQHHGGADFCELMQPLMRNKEKERLNTMMETRVSDGNIEINSLSVISGCIFLTD